MLRVRAKDRGGGTQGNAKVQEYKQQTLERGYLWGMSGSGGGGHRRLSCLVLFEFITSARYFCDDKTKNHF